MMRTSVEDASEEDVKGSVWTREETENCITWKLIICEFIN
jgi:hypothetical protein